MIKVSVLSNDKLYESVSFYNISYKSPAAPKPLRIRFDKIDGFITSPDGEFVGRLVSYR